MPTASNTPSFTVPSPVKIRRWRQYLADERAEAAVYRDLAGRREGEERDILLGLAEAEGRHEAHWLTLPSPPVIVGSLGASPLKRGLRQLNIDTAPPRSPTPRAALRRQGADTGLVEPAPAPASRTASARSQRPSMITVTQRRDWR